MGQKLDKTHQTENKYLPDRHWMTFYTITALFVMQDFKEKIGLLPTWASYKIYFIYTYQ